MLIYVFGKITVLVQQKCRLFRKALGMTERRVSSYIQCTDKVVFPSVQQQFSDIEQFERFSRI